MEMLIFLNGALFVCNVLLLWQVMKKPKADAPDETKTETKETTAQKQWDNLLSYTGEPQEVSSK